MTAAVALKILILGGYGTFGGRLAQLLSDEPRLTLLIAGRSRAKAEAFCATLVASATAVPLAFDRDGDVEAQLRAAARIWWWTSPGRFRPTATIPIGWWGPRSRSVSTISTS